MPAASIPQTLSGGTHSQPSPGMAAQTSVGSGHEPAQTGCGLFGSRLQGGGSKVVLVVLVVVVVVVVVVVGTSPFTAGTHSKDVMNISSLRVPNWSDTTRLLRLSRHFTW